MNNEQDFREYSVLLSHLRFIKFASMLILVFVTLSFLQAIFSSITLSIIINIILDFFTFISSIVGFLWSLVYYPKMIASRSRKNVDMQVIRQQNLPSQIHLLLNQVAITGRIAMLCSIYLNEHQIIFYWITQIILLLLIFNALYLNDGFTLNRIIFKRIGIFLFLIINTIILTFVYIFFDQIYTQSLLQLINIDINLIQYQNTLIILTFLFICIAFAINHFFKRRYPTVALLSYFLAILLSISSGSFQRTIYEQKSLLNQNCLIPMRQLSYQTLSSFGCDKYTQLDQSLFLQCQKQQITQAWEYSDQTFGCLNEKCCSYISQHVFSDVQNLQLFLLLQITYTFSIGVFSNKLSKSINRNRVIRQFFIETLKIIGFFIVVISLSIFLIYFKMKDYSVQTKIIRIKFTELSAPHNSIIQLPSPDYSQFQVTTESKIFYDCQISLAKDFISETIEFPKNKNEITQLRITAKGGYFFFQNEVNDKDLKIIMNDQSIASNHQDVIIIEGSSFKVKEIYNRELYFCTQSPIDVTMHLNQNQINQTIKSETKKNHKLQFQIFQQHSTQNAMLNQIAPINIEAKVIDLMTSQSIQNAELILYNGGFELSPCEINLIQQTHELKTENGSFIIYNLDESSKYTMIVRAPGYMINCKVLNLAHPEMQPLFISVPLTPLLDPYSIRVVLTYNDRMIDLELFGSLKVDKDNCYVGSIFNSCGDMEYKVIKGGIQTILIKQIEPFQYMFFVSKFTNESNIKIMELNAKIQVYKWNFQKPVITYELPICQLQYILIFFFIKVTPQSFSNDQFHWVVFCLDGRVGEQLQEIQKIGSSWPTNCS